MTHEDGSGGGVVAFCDSVVGDIEEAGVVGGGRDDGDFRAVFCVGFVCFLCESCTGLYRVCGRGFGREF